MNRNGRHRPPRPRIEIRAPAASEQEAEAIAAALERFLADTAPPPSRAAQQGAWQRAALQEGVNREPERRF